MKKTMILALAGICLQSAGAAETDSAAVTASGKELCTRVETAVELPNPKKQDNFGGGITIGGGVYHQEFDKFNDVLESQGLDHINKNLSMFSCGFFGLVNPTTRFGFSYEYIWSEDATSQRATSRFAAMNVTGYSVAFTGGHDMISNQKFGLMPTWAVGYYNHSYTFTPRTADFNELLEASGAAPLSFTYSGLALSTGLLLHTQNKFDAEKEELGMLHQPMFGLNLEGGIHYYPTRTLKLDNHKIENGPTMSRYGVYLKLYIDLGERTRPIPEKAKSK